MKRNNIYLVQFGTNSDKNLLPLATGLIVSSLKASREISKLANIKEIIFRREDIEKIKDPSIIGFSCYVWNKEYSLKIAKHLKKKFKKTLIVVGGSDIPNDKKGIRTFLLKNNYIDVIVIGEGEETFRQLCLTKLRGEDLTKINNIAFKIGNEVRINKKKNLIDISKYNSPYLDGTFDKLYRKNKKYFSGAIIEVIRGCPYSCSYCEWGNKEKSLRKNSLEKLEKEIQWISKNKITYLALADANFGITELDLKFTRLLAKYKKKYGYPRYLSLCWAKNSTERILKISKYLNKHNIGFKISLSLQSTNKKTLSAIKRNNFRNTEFMKLKKALEKDKCYCYTEMIMGLPNETYKSFIRGIEKTLGETLYDQIYIYPLFLLPNTELNQEKNIKKYGFKTRKIVTEWRSREYKTKTKEFANFVISTKSMPNEGWRKAYTMSNFMLSMNDDRILFFFIRFLKDKYNFNLTNFIEFLYKEKKGIIKDVFKRLDTHSKKVQEGKESFLMKHNSMTYDPSTAISLYLMENKEEFFITLEHLFFKYWKRDHEKIKDLLRFQKNILIDWKIPKKEISLSYNWNDYFRYTLGEDKVKLLRIPKNTTFLNDGFKNYNDFIKRYMDIKGTPRLNNIYSGKIKLWKLNN